MKYVQNTHYADIEIDLRENGTVVQRVVFSRVSMDRLTGRVISDGFTEVGDETYKKLEADTGFKYMVKLGKLVVQNEAPLRAGSFEQMLSAQQRIGELERENAELKAKLAELNKLQGTVVPKDTPASEPTQPELADVSQKENKRNFGRYQGK